MLYFIVWILKDNIKISKKIVIKLSNISVIFIHGLSLRRENVKFQFLIQFPFKYECM